MQDAQGLAPLSLPRTVHRRRPAARTVPRPATPAVLARAVLAQPVFYILQRRLFRPGWPATERRELHRNGRVARARRAARDRPPAGGIFSWGRMMARVSVALLLRSAVVATAACRAAGESASTARDRVAKAGRGARRAGRRRRRAGHDRGDRQLPAPTSRRDVAPEVSGRVVATPVDVGQFVQAGRGARPAAGRRCRAAARRGARHRRARRGRGQARRVAGTRSRRRPPSATRAARHRRRLAAPSPTRRGRRPRRRCRT